MPTWSWDDLPIALSSPHTVTFKRSFLARLSQHYVGLCFFNHTCHHDRHVHWSPRRRHHKWTGHKWTSQVNSYHSGSVYGGHQNRLRSGCQRCQTGKMTMLMAPKEGESYWLWTVTALSIVRPVVTQWRSSASRDQPISVRCWVTVLTPASSGASPRSSITQVITTCHMPIMRTSLSVTFFQHYLSQKSKISNLPSLT